MRTSFIITFLHLLLLSNSFTQSNSGTACYLYFDVTEGISTDQIADIKKCADALLVEMGLDPSESSQSNIDGYGEFRVQVLNSKYFGRPIDFQLSKRDFLIDNNILFRRRVGSFIKSIKDTLSYCILNSQELHLTHQSILFRPLIEGIKDLLKSKCENKIFVIFSDMLEHNPKSNISFITHPPDQKEFQATFELLKKLYKVEIPSDTDISSIKIHIIRPTYEKYCDERVKVEAFWTWLFGNNCSFQSSINLHN